MNARDELLQEIALRERRVRVDKNELLGLIDSIDELMGELKSADRERERLEARIEELETALQEMLVLGLRHGWTATEFYAVARRALEADE